MLIRTQDEYYDLLRELNTLGDEPLSLDCETTGLRPWLDTELRGISLAWRDRAVYIPVSHPDSFNVQHPQLLAELLATSWTTPHVYHNWKYDAAILERGIGLAPRTGAHQHYDTSVVDWLIDENQRHGLKAIAARIWGEDEAAEQKALKVLFKGETQQEAYKRLRTLMNAEGRKEPAATTREQAKAESLASKRTWADLTAEEIGPYAAQDAALTLRLYHHQLASKDFAHVEPAIQREFHVQEIVYGMERLGVAVDRDLLVATRAKNLERAKEIEAQFDVALGSPAQLAKLIYEEWGLPVHERTDLGAPSTSKAALDPLRGAHPGLDLVLEWRGLTKACSTYYDALLDNADANGRVHTSFNTIGTVTGRWASSTPNLQNLPRGGTNPEVKAVFTAAPGYELWSYDLKSAELFVAASLTGDEEMMAALEEEGRDFHTETAMACFGVAVPTETQRTLAKNLNYGIPYGIGPRKFSSYLVAGTGRMAGPAEYAEAKRLIDAHRAKWKGLHRGIRTLSNYAEVAGRVPLHVPGRFRHFQPDGLFPVPSYHAINAVVQGGVAETMKTWMQVVYKPLEQLGARLVLQVHDALTVEVPTGLERRVHRLLQNKLDLIQPFRMRLTCDIKRGV